MELLEHLVRRKPRGTADIGTRSVGTRNPVPARTVLLEVFCRAFERIARVLMALE